MVAEHYNHRRPEPNQGIQQRLHFFRLSVISKISGHYQYVSLVADTIQLIAQRPIALRE
jgi:hypothetical protein